MLSKKYILTIKFRDCALNKYFPDSVGSSYSFFTKRVAIKIARKFNKTPNSDLFWMVEKRNSIGESVPVTDMTIFECCSKCWGEFTVDEWNVHHSGPDFATTVYHEQCCPTCDINTNWDTIEELNVPGEVLAVAHPITIFRDDTAFLSNFYEYSFVWLGFDFQTAEHAFQASKCSNTGSTYFMAIQCAESPGLAKKLGNSIPEGNKIVSFDHMQLEIMYEILYAKFKQNPVLANKLIATDPKQLIHGNHWHDNYWGTCYCPEHKNNVGANQLGLVLEKVRTQLIFEYEDLLETTVNIPGMTIEGNGYFIPYSIVGDDPGIIAATQNILNDYSIEDLTKDNVADTASLVKLIIEVSDEAREIAIKETEEWEAAEEDMSFAE